MMQTRGGNYQRPNQMSRNSGPAVVSASRGLTRGGAVADQRAARWFRMALIIFICALPLGFIPLQSIGLAFLKPTQLAVVLILAFIPTILRSEAVARSVTMFVFLGVVVRLSVLLISLAWSDYVIDGLTLIVVDFVSALATLLICAMASRFSLSDLAGIFAWGSLGLAISLHFVIFVGHAATGNFSLSIALDALLSGQIRQLKSLYFVGALHGLGLQGVASFFSEVAPKSTNAFGSSILTPTLAAIHLLAADRIMTKTRDAARDWAVRIAMLNAVFCILMAYSDRVTVFAGLILLTHIFYFGFVEGNRKTRFLMIYAFTMGFGALLIYLGWSIAAQDGIGEFVAKFLDNPRFNDLSRILMVLDDGGLFGSGLGTNLNLPGLGYKYAHNLFLADYFSAGLLGLAAAVFWFFVLAKFALAGLFRLLEPNASAAERRLMIGGITIVLYSIALTQLSAQGLFDLNDWIGLGIGLILIIKARQMAFYRQRPNPAEIKLSRKLQRRPRRRLSV